MKNNRRSTKTEAANGLSLKNILKTLKLKEPTISTVLGGLVVLAIAFTIINSLRNNSSENKITQQANNTSQEQALPKTHKVTIGENLWKIAEKYYKSGYNWVDIAKTNNLLNANIVSVGQELTLPEIEPKTTTVAQATPSGEVSAVDSDASISGDSYTVEKGDHLWSIAVRAYGDGYKWTDIAKANNLENPNLIFKDQKLALPRS